MTEPASSPLVAVTLRAADVRRVPILGAALGCAIAAAVLGVIETGTLAAVLVAALWVAVVLLVLSVLPMANTLRLDRDGFRIRAFGVFSRFIPWSAVKGLEAGDGWAGGGLIVDLDEALDGETIVGLPRDHDLGRRSFGDHYGLDAEELASLIARWRTASGGHP